VNKLPKELRKTLTRGRGRELAIHKAFMRISVMVISRSGEQISLEDGVARLK
jgi:hypothetical protein